MKTATILFAATAAATEYGYGYAEKSSSKVAYTTITPGYGKAPVTVTSQYQSIPTYDADAKTWGEYAYVSTVIKDYDGTENTVTKTDQPLTVYHTKTTYTHTSTEAGYGYAQPTGAGGYYGKNATATAPAPKYTTWTEVYEKIHECPYSELGPHALPGYPGSGLYHGDRDHQPVTVREFKHGKWSHWRHTFNYGAPKPEVSTFEHPGTYTIPARDVTVDYPTTVPAEATYTAPAHKPITYGGAYTDVKKPTTITAPYGAYETHAANGKTTTKTVIHYTTITCPHAGHYTIAKPTTTSYDHDTTVTYPTTHAYQPGVYHHSRETVTITKPNQPYTCSYHQTSTYPTPSAYPTPSTTPAHPTQTPSKNSYEPYPTATSSSKGPDSYPTSTPSASKDSYPTETPSSTKPPHPDPSSDYDEPAESYGKPYSGYVKRGGVLERRKAEEKKAPIGKRVILV